MRSSGAIASRHDDTEPGTPGGSQDAPPVEESARAGGPAERPVAESRAAARPRATLAGRIWVALAVGAVLLILLIVFLAENEHDVKISFLGVSTTFPLGLALLLAAVCGAVITLLAGGTRIVQLRRQIRRQRRG